VSAFLTTGPVNDHEGPYEELPTNKIGTVRSFATIFLRQKSAKVHKAAVMMHGLRGAISRCERFKCAVWTYTLAQGNRPQTLNKSKHKTEKQYKPCFLLYSQRKNQRSLLNPLKSILLIGYLCKVAKHGPIKGPVKWCPPCGTRTLDGLIFYY
jgi:hypothetical protein